MSSYSVYQLSEGTQHKQFVECESDTGELILLDPNGDVINNGGYYHESGSRMSYMTGASKGAINEEENEDDFNFEEGKSYSPHDYSGSNPGGLHEQKFRIVKKQSLKPSHHLFELLEMEIARD